MKRKIAVVLVALGFVQIIGCQSPTFSICGKGVKVSDQKEGGESYVVDKVRHGDLAKVYASICWPEGGSGGSHSFRWDVYDKNNNCVRKGSDDYYLFGSSPFLLYLNLDTTAFEKGTYQCYLFLDGENKATVPLVIE